MSTLAERLSSPRVVRRLSWVSGFVLLAGAIAFTIAYFGDSAERTDVRAATAEPAPIETQPTVPLDPKARRVAGEFVVTAVTRQNVKRAWQLAHPELRSAVSRQQWFNGELPVPYYPAKSISGASYTVDMSHPNEAVIDLLILPKKGASEGPVAFFVGLKPVGKGKNKRWLVTYFLPHGGPSTARPDAGAGQ
jgi:hypothetical protein